MTAKKIKCDEISYYSIKELSVAYKKIPQSVAKRVRDGWTAEEAVGLVKRKRKGHGTSIAVEGIEYPTIKDACEKYSVNPKVIRARISNGYSAEDAILGNLKDRGPRLFSKNFIFDNVSYSSGRKVEEKFGVKWSLVDRRIKNGWSKEQALGISEPPPRFRNFEGHARSTNWKTVRLSIDDEVEPIPDVGGYKLYVITNTINGKEYIGITVQSLETRFSQHINSALNSKRKSHFLNAIRTHGAEAFKINLVRNDAKSFRELQEQEIQEIKSRNSIIEGYSSAHGGSLGTSKPIKIAGKLFPSRAQAAEYFGIDIYVFNLRLNRLKWSPEEAAGLVERNWSGKSKSLVVDGIPYKSIRKLSEAYGKNFRKVYDRYSEKGWTIRQALDLDPPPITVKFRGEPIEFEGKKFQSMAELAREFDINPDVIKRKLKKGLQLKDAIEDSILRRKRKY